MPISSNHFDTAKSSEALLENTMRTIVDWSKNMMKGEGVPIIDVRVSRKMGCYHRRHNGVHWIVLGAATFNPKNKKHFKTYVISNGSIYQARAGNIKLDIHIMSVTIEETAHYLQTLEEGGRVYGSVHNSVFFKHFQYLWNKYSDELLAAVQQSLKLDGIEY